MFFKEDKISLVYWNVPNFGDILSPFIVERLSGKEIQHRECYRGLRYVFLETLKRLTGYIKKPLSSINYPFQNNIHAVGSIVSWGNGSSTIWGSGFMNESDGFKGEAKVLAVRGEYTNEKLQKMGFSGSNVYGDPALLLPLLYEPKSNKDYKLGIIPHMSEVDYFINNYGDTNKIIDLRTFDVERIIDEICSCEYILSTSLHGIIVAHAYGIPALWIKKHYINTDGFKFRDYFSSVHIDIYDGFESFEELIGDENKMKQFFGNHSKLSQPDCDMGELRRKLLNAAPFKIKSCYLLS